MTLPIIVAAFVIFIIAVLATDRSQGLYEDRQKDLADKLFKNKDDDDPTKKQ